jgi:2-polyprenyl-3-methyl-5-hydroxy-6-metoxy-1,4-benzoquinol methylase
MEREYAAAYAELYRRHWWWRAREDFLMEVLKTELSPLRRTAILDVGCGAGLFFRRLEELGEAYGVESDLTMRTGHEDVDRRIHWGTLESYHPGHRYGAILFLDVLEHVERPQELLRSALGLLADDGIVIATVPAFRVLWTKHDDVNEHVERYTKTSFVRVAEAAGLMTKSLRYFFHWLFPAKLAVRASEAVRGRASVPSVPAVPGPLLNRTLYSLSRSEQMLGLDRALPFGSSLLYVGAPRPPRAPELR